MKYLRTIGNVIKYFLISFLSQFLFGFLFGIFLVIHGGGHVQSNAAEKYTVLITAISDLIALLIFILMFKNKEENLIKRCKFTKTNISNVMFSILLSLGLILVTSSFLSLTQNVFKDYDKVANTISSGEGTIFGVICVVILIPIFEEIFFRGLIFNELRKNINLPLSIVIQALIFALAHGNIKQGIYTFCLGVIAAIVYTWTKSIWSNIIIHISFNLFGSLVVPEIIYYTKSFIIVYILLGIGIMAFSLIRLNKISRLDIK